MAATDGTGPSVQGTGQVGKVEAKTFQDQGHCQTLAPYLCPLVCLNLVRDRAVSFSDLMPVFLSHPDADITIAGVVTENASLGIRGPVLPSAGCMALGLRSW